MRKFVLFLCLAGLSAAPAAASVPPVGWKGPKWDGPGLLCRGAFTLQLAEGETAEQQYPSVGEIRFTVRSDKGVFEVAEDWYVRDYADEGILVEERPADRLYKLTTRGYGRAYALVPAAAELPVLVRFDPLLTMPPSFVGDEAEQSVLKRVSLTRPEDANCLKPIDPANGERG